MHERKRVTILASAAYFVRFAALGAFAPYMMLWLYDNGHSMVLVGALGSLRGAVAFVSPPLLGAAADAYRRHRLIFMVGTTVNAISVAALTLWPKVAAWQACALVMHAMSDTSALLDALVVRSLAYAGAMENAPRTRAWMRREKGRSAQSRL